MNQEIRLRIILETTLAGVDFGLQKGSGSQYETLQKQRSDGRNLVFEFIVRINDRPAKDTAPNLLGPFVQGPPQARFAYIDIGKAAGQVDSIWSRRLKVPLLGITWAVIEQVFANTGRVLETHIPGIGKDGWPSCGTVKPFGGWQVR